MVVWSAIVKRIIQPAPMAYRLIGSVCLGAQVKSCMTSIYFILQVLEAKTGTSMEEGDR